MIRILSKEEREIEAWREKNRPKVIKGIRAAEKLGLARKRQREHYKATKRILQDNLDGQMAYSIQLEDIIFHMYEIAKLNGCRPVVELCESKFSNKFLHIEDEKPNILLDIDLEILKQV